MSAVIPFMRYECGAEAAVATAEIADRESMNVRFHSSGAVAERPAAALRNFFFPAPWSESCRCRNAATAESGRCLNSRHFDFFFFSLDSY